MCYSSGLVSSPYPSAHPPPPPRMCQEVNTYLLCMVGCALPLLWACLLRARAAARMRQRAQSPTGLPRAAAAAAEAGEGCEACTAAWVVQPLTCLVLASCTAWGASGVAALALHG